MNFTNLTELKDAPGVLDRVIDALSVQLEGDEPVDIITFAEGPKYLNFPLYPRQRLFLKLYYRLDLTDEELQDTKELLSCQNKYAKLYFPGLCEHHITGEDCGKTACHISENLHDMGVLSDQEIRRRLKNHHAHILEVIAGRRGSKSALGAIINAYETYKFLRSKNPQANYGIYSGMPIGTLNVATDERQALILFDQFKVLLEASPWFAKHKAKTLTDIVEFPGRGVYAKSLHSNSQSIRGNTVIAVFIDEYCFFNKTLGKHSDAAMMSALAPSTIQFGTDKRIVITSSPFVKSGTAWEYFHAAIERLSPHVIAIQMATWEMNPTIDPEKDSEIQNAYLMDKVAAEMEYGGQWADQAGAFIPEEAVRACMNKDLSFQHRGSRGLRYTLHVDMSKKHDKCALVVVHFDKERGKVIVDRAEQFDPKDPDDKVVNQLGEIDHELVYKHIVMLAEQYNFRFNSITFDQFNSQALVQALRKKYGEDVVEEININEKTNREIYSNLRTQLVQGGVEYYQDLELMKQLVLLARTEKSDRSWKVEAPPGYYDDLADSLAAATLICQQKSGVGIGAVRGVLFEPKVDKAPEGTPTLSHHKDCRDSFCVWGCPINEAIQKGQL
jgi:hypothetical protein